MITNFVIIGSIRKGEFQERTLQKLSHPTVESLTANAHNILRDHADAQFGKGKWTFKPDGSITGGYALFIHEGTDEREGDCISIEPFENSVA